MTERMNTVTVDEIEYRVPAVILDLLNATADERDAAKARVAELESLHCTYYNQPFAEACQRAASEERERCIDRALAWWAITTDLDAIPTDVAAESIRAALEGRHPDLDLNPTQPE